MASPWTPEQSLLPRPARTKRRGETERQRATLRTWGRLELFTAELSGASVALAPSLDEKMVLGEEALRHLQHFEVLATQYGEAGGRHLTKDASQGAASQLRPRRWSEAGVAHWLLLAASRAAAGVCLQTHDGLGTQPARPLEGIAAELRDQFALADALLRELLQRKGPHQTTFEGDAEQWISLVLALMVGQLPGTEMRNAERAFLATIATAFPSPDVRARFNRTT